MICVRLEGGLGNQLFQHAAARALARRHRTAVVWDLQALVTQSDAARTEDRVQLEWMETASRTGTPTVRSIEPDWIAATRADGSLMISITTRFSFGFGPQ